MVALAALATLAGWGYVVKKLHDRPSPGHWLETGPFQARDACEGVAVVEGERVWLSCPWAMVRVDPRSRTALSFPITIAGKLHGFAPRPDGAVVLVGDALFALDDRQGAGDVTPLGRDPSFEQALGLHASASSVEVVAPHDVVRLSVDVWRYAASSFESRRALAWRTDVHDGPLQAVSARKKEGRNEEWRILYQADPSAPLFVAGENPGVPKEPFDDMLNRQEGANVYLDPLAEVFPPALEGRSQYRTSVIRLGRSKVADWQLGGMDFVRADLLATPEGLIPLVESKEGILRHGRTLTMKRDVDSQLHAAWTKSSEADPVAAPALASDWPIGRTVVVPLGDGGVAFVSSRGRVAIVNRDLERTDTISGPARLWLALKRMDSHQARWASIGFLLGWPFFALCGMGIAVVTRRRPLVGVGLASAAWILSMVVFYQPGNIFLFAGI